MPLFDTNIEAWQSMWRLTQRSVSRWLQHLRCLLCDHSDAWGKRLVADVTVGRILWYDDQPVFLPEQEGHNKWKYKCFLMDT